MLSWLPSEPATFISDHYRQLPSNTYQPSYLSSPSIVLPSSLMPTTDARNPTVRLHQSTPSPIPQSPNKKQSMLTQTAFVGSGWGNESFPGAGYLNANTIPRGFKRTPYHKRKSSGSSVTSAGPPSPLDHTTAYPQIATSDLSHLSPSYEAFDYTSPHSAHTPKSLPTPVGTPTSNSLMASQYHHNGAQDATAYSQNMRRLQTSAPDEDVSYAFSAPQSVSSMSHNSPATPHTNYEVDYEEQKTLYAGYQSAAFNQAMQDVFPDQMYSPASYSAQTQPAVPRFNSHLSPHRSVFANRLQAANQDHLSARTSSPVTSVPRDQSPFRQNSPFIEQARMGGPRSSQQMTAVPVSQPQEPTKSVSPKELMIDEHDIDDQTTPLFQDQSNSVFSNRRPSANMSNFQSGLYNNHYPQNTPIQVPQQYPFVSQHRPESSHHQTIPDRTPEFPAHLPSMESTADDGPSEPSSQRQPHYQPSHSIQRPEDTSSDAGTYTCTYHGCTQRFETPAQLQKHKREGHRQISPASAPTAQSIALRNSQAGPHKCERINPSTGKPCNSIFSRPYDLTRHEDTIHNARKQKVRCHLCTEEKTFSRNDALTRHMRVVHPDVDWPGKTRRKNGRD